MTVQKFISGFCSLLKKKINKKGGGEVIIKQNPGARSTS